MMSSSVGFTTAELLAMRPNNISHTTHNPLPTSLSQYIVPEYCDFRRAVTSSNVLTFANYQPYPTVPDIITLSPNHTNSQCITWASIDRTYGVLRPASRAAQWVRYSRNIASFNLYPSTSHDLKINHLLWRVAQAGEYDPSNGNLLLGHNIISLAMPKEFFSLLSSVDETFLNYCIYEVLALISEDEDVEGLRLMESELEPTVWEKLQDYISNRRDTLHNRTFPVEDESNHTRSVSEAVEILLRLCYLSPWRIDIFAAYISPSDMYSVLAEAESLSKCEHGKSPYDLPDVEHDRQLVRSSARRPVSTPNYPFVRHSYQLRPSQYVSSTLKAPILSGHRSRFTNRNIVFWKLFQDWRRYRKVLVECLNMHPMKANEKMMDSIANSSHITAWERAEAVMAFSMKDGNPFFHLPRETVFHLIAPYILAQG